MPRPQLVARPDMVRRRRLEAVLTQQQLADNAGVSVARIRSIEVGRELHVQPQTAHKLATALSCSVHDLVQVVDDEVPA
jgi:DNA-binding Xre family transcriptional regulator